MIREQHVSDEAIIDAILNQLPPRSKEKLALHLGECESCSRRTEKWKAVLTPTGDAAASSFVPDKVLLKQRILQSVAHVNRKPHWATRLHAERRKWALIGTGTVAGFVLLWLTLFAEPSVLQNGDYIATQNSVSEEATFIGDPRTSQYEVIPLITATANGAVWVNDVTQEMLIQVDGLEPVIYKDYQMWFLDNRGGIQGEIIEIREGKVVLYLHGNGVERIYRVRTSLEPKGGSPLPTGTDAFMIDLKR